MVLREKESIGQILVSMSKLDTDDLNIALREHAKTGERLGTLLVKMGLATEEDILEALSKQLDIPLFHLADYQPDPDAIARMPAKVANHYQLFPLEVHGNTMKVAVNDPLDIHTLDDVRLLLKYEIEPVIASRKEIAEAIKKFYGIGADTMEELARDETSGDLDLETGESGEVVDMAEDASIVKFVNQIISEAINDRATDIHVEPFEGELRIRYRIDGVLYETAIPPTIKRFQSAIISRIKIMSNMNIAEKRLPQDGRIRVKRQDKEFDLRVSTVPTPYGESISLRILTRDSELINLERLGLLPDSLQIMRRLISKPHGIILVTGPTGSGKSTTLYASLQIINHPDKKIITIEDPIEYRLRGVTQIQVVPNIGLTFARSLRTILRQDPDVIMVGEVRDQETAQITIRTALTGHLVFSTLHTNDAAGAVTRLLDMGIEPFLVSSSVEGMIAQRLVRVNCPHCKQAYKPHPALIDRVNVSGEDCSDIEFTHGTGCEKCRYTGYLGRTAIYEIITMSESIRTMVIERRSANQIKEEAVRSGMKTLRADGWEKVKNGITTIDEVLKVSQDSHDDEPVGLDETR